MKINILKKVYRVNRISLIITLFFSLFILSNCSSQEVNKIEKSQQWGIPLEVKGLDNLSANEDTILIHCYHGADRIGMMGALYRMVYQNWEREETLSEMLNDGYGYHSMWKDIVAFIKEVNVEQLKKDSQINT